MVSGYQPLKITGNTTGLVQQREEFLLPDDAYPFLQNAYVWRERLLRKKGYQLLGRLQRVLTQVVLGVVTPVSTDAGGNVTVTITPNPIAYGVASFTIGTETFTDPGGPLVVNPVVLLTNSLGATHTLDRTTGILTITGSIPLTLVNYFPGLPVMGVRTRENQDTTFYQTIFFDQDYAYTFNGTTFQEFIPGETWNANNDAVTGVDFFWTTNYFVGNNNRKIFWVTNSSWVSNILPGDPIRYTNSISWADFSPIINNANDVLVSCLAMLPFRGRLVVFNTVEGPSPTNANTKRFSNRIRWSAIGTPFTVADASIPPIVSVNLNPKAWNNNIRGQGGFLDIPTSEDIVSVGFVRDNLVIYCERSTWQLRYTGRTISPFQIEKVNSENGVEGTFSTVQFDTSLVGIGDKGILECDSFKSELIDIKIPDLVFQFQNANNGPERVHGFRDFVNRLAYWTIPIAAGQLNLIFPNQRLIYNYENDSWALFNDSLTTIGTIQVPTGRTWLNTPDPWVDLPFPWISEPVLDPDIIGGNQQGFVEKLDELNTNDVSLFIQNILGHAVAGPPTTGTATVITSPNHNMQSGFVIQISGITTATPYANLNGGIFGIIVIDANNFALMLYNPLTDAFSTPQLDVPSGLYAGSGLIAIRENFLITSKKFNFLDEGQSIQLGYIDILMDASEAPLSGAISLKVFLDYNDIDASNTLPRNVSNDTCFNSIIPTISSVLNNKGGTKFWQRVFCPTRANFLTLQYTFSNAQMVGVEQTTEVQIDAQVLWIRQAGRNTQI